MRSLCAHLWVWVWCAFFHSYLVLRIFFFFKNLRSDVLVRPFCGRFTQSTGGEHSRAQIIIWRAQNGRSVVLFRALVCTVLWSAHVELVLRWERSVPSDVLCYERIYLRCALLYCALLWSTVLYLIVILCSCHFDESTLEHLSALKLIESANFDALEHSRVKRQKSRKIRWFALVAQNELNMSGVEQKRAQKAEQYYTRVSIREGIRHYA